jgi:Ran GTPase-activating protein (RanGAP) involved in mRNA processing and transport
LQLGTFFGSEKAKFAQSIDLAGSSSISLDGWKLIQCSQLLILNLSDCWNVYRNGVVGQIFLKDVAAWMHTVCMVMESNSSLTVLDLSRNKIGSAGAKQLASAVQDHPALRSLDITNTRLDQIDDDDDDEEFRRDTCLEGLVALCDVIKHHKVLTNLTFGGEYDYNEDTCDEIRGDPVTITCSMTEADFSNQHLLSSGMIILAAFIPKCHSLQTIDISANGEIDAIAAHHLGSSIKDHLWLSKITFAGDPLDDHLWPGSCRDRVDLNEKLEKKNGPISLVIDQTSCDFSDKYLGVYGAIIAAAFLPKMTGLASVNLLESNIGIEQAAMFNALIEESMPLCSTLCGLHPTNLIVCLDLSNSFLGVDGALLLANEIKNNRLCAIGSLDLHKCHLAPYEGFSRIDGDDNEIVRDWQIGERVVEGGIEGVVFLWEDNPEDFLGLQYEQGLDALGDAFEANDTLFEVDITGNEFSIAQADRFNQIMQRNNQLTTLCGLSHIGSELDLSDERVIMNGWALLLSAGIQSCLQLTRLDLSCNSINDNTVLYG